MAVSYRYRYSKTCLKRLLKQNTKIGFQDKLWLNAGQKYCRMFQGEHSAILLTFIKLRPFFTCVALAKAGLVVGPLRLSVRPKHFRVPSLCNL